MINNDYCLNPLNFGVICYTVIANYYTHMLFHVFVHAVPSAQEAPYPDS